MQVYNVMEEIVRNEITNNLGQLNMSCTCDYCLSDVLAISLNDLPPRYIVDQSRNPLVRAMHVSDRQETINILKTISQAVTIVNNNRRCEN